LIKFIYLKNKMNLESVRLVFLLTTITIVLCCIFIAPVSSQCGSVMFSEAWTQYTSERFATFFNATDPPNNFNDWETLTGPDSDILGDIVPIIVDTISFGLDDTLLSVIRSKEFPLVPVVANMRIFYSFTLEFWKWTSPEQPKIEFVDPATDTVVHTVVFPTYPESDLNCTSAGILHTIENTFDPGTATSLYLRITSYPSCSLYTCFMTQHCHGLGLSSLYVCLQTSDSPTASVTPTNTPTPSESLTPTASKSLGASISSSISPSVSLSASFSASSLPSNSPTQNSFQSLPFTAFPTNSPLEISGTSTPSRSREQNENSKEPKQTKSKSPDKDKDKEKCVYRYVKFNFHSFIHGSKLETTLIYLFPKCL
jgi:hypothetical protein